MSGHTDRVTTLVSLAVLGVGFVAMALDVTGFWLVWALGFGVVVPAVAVLRGRSATTDGAGDEVDDALATLRERYARGELSESAFEAKVEALLETETPETAREPPETARERLDRERAGDTERET
ncbi:SHOCT domain-containing protein [Haloplanus salilacus]|uniref:SHOCT domain-containing protein n=1 Tax=Haloplanus salilacus TaxID=2949994 RepID=UPI0030CF0A93